METVLIFGASSNVGVSAVFGALHRKLNVLAIVSDQAEADELLQHFNTTRGITVVEADITDEDAMLDVVEKVKTGDLPAFQHVYSSGAYAWTLRFSRSLRLRLVGFLNPKIKIQDTATTFRNIKRFTVDANICKSPFVNCEYIVLTIRDSRLSCNCALLDPATQHKAYVDPSHWRTRRIGHLWSDQRCTKGTVHAC